MVRPIIKRRTRIITILLSRRLRRPQREDTKPEASCSESSVVSVTSGRPEESTVLSVSLETPFFVVLGNDVPYVTTYAALSYLNDDEVW